jgi:hypothetical protein
MNKMNLLKENQKHKLNNSIASFSNSICGVTAQGTTCAEYSVITDVPIAGHFAGRKTDILRS